MKKNKSVFPSSLFYFIGLCALLFYTFIELQPRILMSPLVRVIILAIVCLCVYLGSRSLCRYQTTKTAKIMRCTFAAFFALYVGLLINFTLLDPMFFRTLKVTTIFSEPATLQNYLSKSVNLIPFTTIWEYCTSLINRTKSLSVIITNLMGNFIALMPMALFLPILFKKCRRFLPFVFTTLVIVSIIELLQLFFVSGTCDIDDLILNVLGAAIAYAILRVRPVHSAVQKITVIDF